MYFRDGFPSIAYYIPDAKNLQGRIPFKCRILEETPQFFTQSASGLTDIGMGAQLVTYKNFTFTTQSKVLWNNVLYSVQSIIPYIPDPAMQGFTKKRTQIEYIMNLV